MIRSKKNKVNIQFGGRGGTQWRTEVGEGLEYEEERSQGPIWGVEKTGATAQNFGICCVASF